MRGPNVKPTRPEVNHAWSVIREYAAAGNLSACICVVEHEQRQANETAELANAFKAGISGLMASLSDQLGRQTAMLRQTTANIEASAAKLQAAAE